MEMDCSLPLPLSLAVTLRMPLASMSKVTSICGYHGSRRNAIRRKFPATCYRRHPFRPGHVDLHVGLTVHSRGVRLGLLRGNVVFRVIILVITAEGLHAGSRVTSSSRMSFTSPARTPPWMAAPTATTSSGSRSGWGPCWWCASPVQHGRDTGGTTHRHGLVQLVGGELGVLERLLHRDAAAVDQIRGQLFEPGAGESEIGTWDPPALP